jgi:large subunit ribosomal protein L9
MARKHANKRGKFTPAVGGGRPQIELLLAEDVEHVGKAGEIVRVKPGYARNYLLPQGYATVASEHNKKMVERHRQRLQAIEADKLKAIKKLADAVERYSVTLEANANPEGQLYGSILAHDISRALKSASFPVEPEHLLLEGPLKECGMYTIKVKLHEKVQTDLKVWVVPTASSAN